MVKHEKIKLVEVNSHLTCHLCKGYYIDATTIVECLHSFCRSCIIKFLEKNCYCPVCEVIINKAKPNIKPDKTLQDVVYKLVPELFTKEMHRRQVFYADYPEEAAKVTPETRGVDTERTIFNPKDSISLSIEYASDECHTNLLPLPLSAQNGATRTSTRSIRNGLSSMGGGGGGGGLPTTVNLTSDVSALKRFLKCPSIMSVDVMKKFIASKYRVDTNKYHIDILYKRIPLPDQYTLIDIAYIYSWKGNEPMRFFFRISDANLVQDDIDFVEPKPPVNRPATKPDLVDENVPPKLDSGSNVNKVAVDKETSQSNKATALLQCKNETSVPVVVTVVDKKEKKESVVVASPKQNVVRNKDDKTSGGDNNNKASPKSSSSPPHPANSKNGGGVNKKDAVAKNASRIGGVEKLKNCIVMQYIGATKPKTSPQSVVKLSPPSPVKKPSPVETSPEIDMEKSQFLKSIQLTAINVIQAMSPEKLDLPKVSTPVKRAASSSPPNRSPKKAKQAKKVSPKAIHNPVVRQIVTNVNQQVSNLRQDVSKIVGGEPTTANNELKSLFDSCKINIPSSLSITLKETTTDDANCNKTSTPIKPVQNYIEILKLPDTSSSSAVPKETTTTPPVSPPRTSNVDNKSSASSNVPPRTPPPPTKAKSPKTGGQTVNGTTESATPNLAQMLQNTPHALPNKTAPAVKLSTSVVVAAGGDKATKSFQKMFEEAVKNDFNKTLPMFPVKKVETTTTVGVKKVGQINALDLSTTATTTTTTSSSSSTTTATNGGGGKRKIADIAQQLYKKTKLEQEKQNLKVVGDGGGERKKMLSPPPPQAALPHNGKVAIPRLAASGTPPPSGRVNIPQSLPTFQSYVSQRRCHKMASGNKTAVPSSPKTSTNTSPKSSSLLPSATSLGELSPNQLLEKYNIPNLAQLSANFNLSQASQLAAMQQAIALRQFEMQNRQNWINNMNSNALVVQYEKLLQKLNPQGHQLLGNKSEH